MDYDYAPPKKVKSTNQPTNQPINQSTNQPINQSTNQPTNQSIQPTINQVFVPFIYFLALFQGNRLFQQAIHLRPSCIIHTALCGSNGLENSQDLRRLQNSWDKMMVPPMAPWLSVMKAIGSETDFWSDFQAFMKHNSCFIRGFVRENIYSFSW